MRRKTNAQLKAMLDCWLNAFPAKVLPGKLQPVLGVIDCNSDVLHDVIWCSVIYTMPCHETKVRFELTGDTSGMMTLHIIPDGDEPLNLAGLADMSKYVARLREAGLLIQLHLLKRD